MIVWMEREFHSYKLTRSMYPSIFNSFPVIRTASAKNRRFHVPQPTFLFPLETPLWLSRNMLHGWKDNSMLAKALATCTYLSSIVWYGFLCYSVRENEWHNIVLGNLLSIYCNKNISQFTTAKTILNCAKLLQRRHYVQLMLMLYPISCSHTYNTNV